jgi:hypothetical protein
VCFAQHHAPLVSFLNYNLDPNLYLASYFRDCFCSFFCLLSFSELFTPFMEHRFLFILFSQLDGPWESLEDGEDREESREW